mgnify:FL=1
MNLLYSAFIREVSESIGVTNKVYYQCYAFRKEFENVYLYVSRADEAVLYKVEKDDMKAIKTFKYNKLSVFKEKSKIRKIRSFIRYNSFLNYLNKIIYSYDINILYIRSSIPSKKLISILNNKQVITVLEYPTYPFEEECKKTKTKIEQFVFWNNKPKKIENLADLVVGISGEKDINVDEKFILTSNGIQLNNINLKKRSDKNYVNILSVANIGFTHGYDRIIKGLYEYYKNNPKKEVFYHCVGDGSELANLKKLTKELSLEKYVIFHGAKTGEELDKVFDESDIALGSLGNHRKGLNSDSALKNREYCARGIPFVIASSDQDFPESFPYILKIPSDDSPVDINEIVEWYEKLTHSHLDYSSEMRKYAEEHLSWDEKMKPVIEKIKRIADKKGICKS